MQLEPGHLEISALPPKDPAANAAFRAEMVCKGSESAKNARTLWDMCRRSPLFYLNTFGYTFDPRRDPSVLPFITYDFQDDAISVLVECLGDEDVLIEKSRDMGASWMGCVVFEWCWHFQPHQSLLMGSRNEGYVDDAANPKSLFSKVDFLTSRLPKWLKPKIKRKHLSIVNLSNGSVIDGESTTGDFARGDRRTAILLDEFAAVTNGFEVLNSTRDVTLCRIFNSTPQGQGNAFYDMHMTDIRKLRLHWSSHPIKNVDMYVNDEGKQRSPWYDAECLRMANTSEAAQELDIDFQGSDFQFFDGVELDKAIKRDVRPAYHVGDVEFDPEGKSPVFHELPNGPVSLWCILDNNKRPSSNTRYCMGIDISTGAGNDVKKKNVQSNSCISIVDMGTREKVGEIVLGGMSPERFAIMACAVGNFFSGIGGQAYMVWEANGPGVIFGNRVTELGYGNIHWRRNELKMTRTVVDKAGWWSTREEKKLLLGKYRTALANGTFVNRCKAAIDECRAYIHTQSGAIEHSRAARSLDPRGMKDNHGDRVIADALANFGMGEDSSLLTGSAKKSIEAPVGSFKWRRDRFHSQQRELETASW